MDTLDTVWGNITHYKTESVHFWGLMNSAIKLFLLSILLVLVLLLFLLLLRLLLKLLLLAVLLSKGFRL